VEAGDDSRALRQQHVPVRLHRSGQLLVWQFAFGPSYQAGDPLNSSIADAVDGVLGAPS
jgi:hypothetical protein